MVNDFWKLERLMNFEAVYYKISSVEKFRLFKLSKQEFESELRQKIIDYQLQRYGQVM